MSPVTASMVVVIAGLIAGVLIFVLRKKNPPVTPAPFLRPGTSKSSSSDKVALMELAGKAVGQYPELGSTPAELLAEIDTYLGKVRRSPANTPHIILEKMLV